MEYYSVLKMNEIVIHATTLFNLEDTMVSEISQSQKGTLCHPRPWSTQRVKFIETGSGIVVTRGWEGTDVGWGVIFF